MVDARRETPDLPDYELLPPAGKPPDLPPRKRPWELWLAVAGLIVVTAIAAYLAMGGRTTSAPVTTEPGPVEAPQPPVQPLGGDAAPIVLPPLDQTDPVVRELLKQITSHPRVAAWLATEGLIRNFVVVVSSVAEGRTPVRLELGILAPNPGFGNVARRPTSDLR